MPRPAVAPLRPVVGRALPAQPLPRRYAAGWLRLAGALVAPLVAVVAALAGLLYAILLPVCGLASVAAGLATSGWQAAKDLAHGRRPSHETRT